MSGARKHLWQVPSVFSTGWQLLYFLPNSASQTCDEAMVLFQLFWISSKHLTFFVDQFTADNAAVAFFGTGH